MTTGSVLAQFTITLSQAVSEQVAVVWHTADGTALAGVDYAAAKGTVLFAPGQTAKTVDILVHGRAVGAEDRSFFVEMLPPTNAILGASIGECIIHVDTTGSTPVTQIIVPTGPQGPEGKSAYQTWLDLGNTGSEQDFIDSLSPSPEEIAEDVAPLIDVGDTVLTAEGTEGLSKPDATTVKAVARRVAYVGAAKIATVVLADGDNLIAISDLTGDTVDFNSIGFYPRILRVTSFVSPHWGVVEDGRLLVSGAVAGDVLYACQYDVLSGQAVKNIATDVAMDIVTNTTTPADRLNAIQSHESLRRSYAEVGLALRPESESFEDGGTLTSATDVLKHHGSGKAFSGSGPFPQTIDADTSPTGPGFYDQSGKVLTLKIQGSPLQAAQPWVAPIDTAYAGVRKINLVMQPGETLSARAYPSPTHIEGLAAGDIIPAESGVLFKFGATGLTSGAGWTQDSYELSNLKIVKGSPEIATFEPWTGHLATIRHLDIANNGDPTKWALNFKQQNWWPHVIGNTWSDVIDKKGNFCKAIDDAGDPDLRYSGNSRMLFSQNRLRWLGTTLGGRGFYGSATANILRDNAMEGASIPVTLGSPSTFTAVDGLYTESPYGNQCVMQLGDDFAAPNNSIAYVEARHVYNNMHGLASNKIVQMGHGTVSVNHFKLDEFFIAGAVPTQPVISINDIPGQKVEVGRIESGGMPLLPMTNNHVNVLDMYHQSLDFLNGDLAHHLTSPVSVPAATYTKVANGWYVRTAGASICYFAKADADAQKLRMSRKFMEIAGIPAGSQTNIVYEHTNPAGLVGTDFTVQFFTRLNQTVTATISVEAWSSTVRQTLYTTTKTLSAQWTEQSMAIYGDPSALEGADVLAININFTPASSASIDITGMRGNRGSCGLCLSPSDISVGRTIAETNAFPNYITP